MYNQFPNPDFQRFYGPQVPYPRQPDVVGEGDVVPTNGHDGSIQLYFVPVLRRPYPPFPGNVTSYPANCECWYIRSICNENPSTFMNYLMYNASVPTPNMSANNLKRDTSYDFYGNQYFQKFHNDHSTSTTDIHYFYPSLRFGEQKLNICVAIQTEFNTLLCCKCMHEFAVNSHRNYEQMCVDEGPKSRYTNVENFNEKSNKLVATYTDASSNCAEGVDRETQTAVRRIERSDVIATEEYVPRKRVRRPRSESCSSDCSCTTLR